ncbi:MAG: CBS domain-containing protein [Kiritimatiellae bacterium]|nr:CBS domain-containing protein [Kiritimatiellia bacterium]
MKVSDVLAIKGSVEVYRISKDSPLAEAVKLACDKGIGALLVEDADGQVVGIITERDVLHHVNNKTDFENAKVSDVMTRDLVTVRPDDDIHLAMDMMIMQKFRHLPILDGNTIHGIITIRDIIQAMRKADETDVRYLVEYIRGNIKIP